MGETDPSADATLAVAYAVADAQLFELTLALIDAVLAPHPHDAALPLPERLAACIETLGAAADLEPGPVAAELSELGAWSAEEAQALAAEILGNTLASLHAHILRRAGT